MQFNCRRFFTSQSYPKTRTMSRPAMEIVKKADAFFCHFSVCSINCISRMTLYANCDIRKEKKVAPCPLSPCFPKEAIAKKSFLIFLRSAYAQKRWLWLLSIIPFEEVLFLALTTDSARPNSEADVAKSTHVFLLAAWIFLLCHCLIGFFKILTPVRPRVSAFYVRALFF